MHSLTPQGAVGIAVAMGGGTLNMGLLFSKRLSLRPMTTVK
jgi:hypothetical protein